MKATIIFDKQSGEIEDIAYKDKERAINEAHRKQIIASKKSLDKDYYVKTIEVI